MGEVVPELGLDKDGATAAVGVTVAIGAFDDVGVDTLGLGVLGITFSCSTEATGVGSSETAFTAAGEGADFDSATGTEAGASAGAGTGDGTVDG